MLMSTTTPRRVAGEPSYFVDDDNDNVEAGDSWERDRAGSRKVTARKLDSVILRKGTLDKKL